MTRFGSALAGVAAACVAIGSASPAQAYWHRGGDGWGGGGIGFGFNFAAPAYVPPPYYVAPPPVFYAPPPLFYPPPPVYYYSQPSGQPVSGQSCYAGAYVCPLDTPAAMGAPCSCPGNNGRVNGRTG